MRRFLVLVCIAGALPATEAFGASGFFWFHTRPKSVLLNDDQQKSSQTRVAYHGTAVYPGSGRLYFADSVDNIARPDPQPKSRLTSVFSGGWLTGSAATKPAQPKSAQK